MVDLRLVALIVLLAERDRRNWRVLVLDLDGRRLSRTQGALQTVGGADQPAPAVRLGADGRPDRLAGSEARFISLDDRGRILIAGETHDENYMSRDDSGLSYPAVARLLA